MLLRTVLCTFLVVVTFAAPLIPQEDKGEPGVIVGTVVDSNGRPVANVRVYIQEFGMPTTGTLDYVLTDGNGRFRFDKIRLGSFKVTAAPGGTSASLTSHYAVMVQLSKRNPTREIKLRLRPTTERLNY